jgi:ribosomal protein S18 acetylase RimI-like enzyme
MPVKICPIEEKDHSKVVEIVREFWGDETIAVHGNLYDVGDLEGLKAIKDNTIIGILHYQIEGKACEILTLASRQKGQGIGSMLIEVVEDIARQNQCQKMRVVTTNDNLQALGFYQRRGYHLAALFPNQLKISRRLKPGIPEIGDNNIPLRDELHLEKSLI